MVLALQARKYLRPRWEHQTRLPGRVPMKDGLREICRTREMPCDWRLHRLASRDDGGTEALPLDPAVHIDVHAHDLSCTTSRCEGSILGLSQRPCI